MELTKLLQLLFVMQFFLELNARKRRSKNYRHLKSGSNSTMSKEEFDKVRRSWFNLLEENKKEEKKLKRKLKNYKHKHDYDFMGPPGPQGPPGLPGTVGTPVSQEKLISEFRTIIRATADKRVKKFGGGTVSFMAAGVPDVLSAFLIELQQNVVVPKKTFAFLRGFHHSRAGTFVRGAGLDLNNGRYVAPYTAIYRFQTALNIGRPFKVTSLKPHNAITARICINSDCEKNLSLKFRTGISSNSKTFTINVIGHLYLQKNQYVEVVVENTAANKITILADSTFSGCLVGA